MPLWLNTVGSQLSPDIQWLLLEIRGTNKKKENSKKIETRLYLARRYFSHMLAEKHGEKFP